jgi:hypothetical protein
MSKNLRIDLEIGLDKARAALKQLQQEANQISKARGGVAAGGLHQAVFSGDWGLVRLVPLPGLPLLPLPQ